MDKVEKIEYFAISEQLEIKSFPTLEAAMEGQNWLVFKELHGRWLNAGYSGIYQNYEYGIEFYKNTGEQIIEIILGKFKLKKMTIGISTGYSRDSIQFTVVSPNSNEEQKNFGSKREGIISAVRFLWKSNYEYILSHNKDLTKEIDEIKRQLESIKEELEKSEKRIESERLHFERELEQKSSKIEELNSELLNLKEANKVIDDNPKLVQPNSISHPDISPAIDETEHSAISQLENLIGLKNVKEEVKKLISVAKIRQLRKSRGLGISPQTLHSVFSGNPGTGKTTVARILSNIYQEIGLLSKGHLVEVDRSMIVEKYVGHTAKKMQEIVNSARGGILFIDEAYSLYKPGSSNDFGQEAIDTLVKLMEDYRDDLVVIAAGYSKDMDGFLDSNLGLKSRFSYKIDFEDYDEDELMTIFLKMCSVKGYSIHEELYVSVKKLIVDYKNKDAYNFGNARGVRNLFEKIEINQMARLGSSTDISNQDLITITLEDIPKS